MSLLTDHVLYLFNEGSNGINFAVWAPNAESVAVIGTFNNWDLNSHPMQPQGQSGIWETFIPRLQPGEPYKYHVVSRFNGYKTDKADPFAFYTETPPYTASKTW